MTAPAPPVSASLADPAARSGSTVAWSDPQRAHAFDRWLQRIAPSHRLLTETVRLASADASFRRYLRVDTDGQPGTRIVMDAPPDKENSAPFVQVAELLRDAGVTAPQVLEWERDDGFLLLDDLGTQTLLDVIDPERPEANRPRYEQAIDALIRWQLASKPGVLPPYDAALLHRELSLFPDWYLARHRGIAVEGKLKETLDKTFALIVDTNLASASVYVHRDFMPRNLMIHSVATPGGGSAEQLAVLDFQDAVYGPITYDIASLMRDAFLSWDESFVIDITVRYWEAARRAKLPVDADFGEFYRAVEWMGLQRHLKVAGIFARLTLRDGKPRYLADAPRFIHYIRATASRYRELKPLLQLIDQVEGTQAAVAWAFGRV